MTDTDVKHTPDGVIDVEFHIERAKKMRNDYVAEVFSGLVNSIKTSLHIKLHKEMDNHKVSA